MPSNMPPPPISPEKQRFIQALEEARIKGKYSQRQLCEALGITIGTLTKYNRGSVDPYRIGVAIMRRLASELGVTTNTLMEYLDTGEFRSTLSIDDVASWIRSESGQVDLPILLSAVTESAQRLTVPVMIPDQASNVVPEFTGYTDQEAEVFCDSTLDCMKLLSTEVGKSLRGAWKMIEVQLEALGDLTEDEMDLCYDVCSGSKVLSGAELTAAKENFTGRYETPCPIATAMSKIDELKGCEPLDLMVATVS